MPSHCAAKRQLHHMKTLNYKNFLTEFYLRLQSSVFKISKSVANLKIVHCCCKKKSKYLQIAAGKWTART